MKKTKHLLYFDGVNSELVIKLDNLAQDLNCNLHAEIRDGETSLL